MERIGVFLCTGCDIGKAVHAEQLEKLALEKGASAYAAHFALCSPGGISALRKSASDNQLDGVVVAACSPGAKTAEFSFDATRIVLDRVSLREQVAWTHEHGHEDTQMLAEDLLRMGLARVSKAQLTKPLAETIERTVLVVGGGLAGLHAACGAAGAGHPTVLVEATGKLGGYLNGVKELVPERPPYDSPHPNTISELVKVVESSPRTRVLLSTKIKRISGQPGQFDVWLEGPSGEQTLKVGAIVQATGARPYDARKLSHLGYGKSPDVVTSTELEAMLLEGRLVCPSTGRPPRKIVFVQCAGSRDPQHLPYCSTECCATALKLLSGVHAANPQVECVVVYRDLRAPGQLEHFYTGVQERTGGFFTRGVVKQVEVGDGGALTVTVTESLLGQEVTLAADLVVLSVGMVPNSADGEAIRNFRDAVVRAERGETQLQRKQAAQVVEELEKHRGTEILNLTYRQGPDLPALAYGFPDSHYICFPYETRRTGIYAAGTLRAPMDHAQAAEDGWGASLKAVQCISALTRGEAVHPRSGDQSTAQFFLQRCTQCKRCTEECPFGTINEDEKGTPQYNPLRCRRCGICVGCCPERIVSFPEYSVDTVSAMIKAIEVPDEFDEKPRLLAFMCENDALPALDDAARRRLQWNPWVRVIPVRCLGAINVVWIADALSRGIDGVLLMGCKRGSDYQCHYIRGSELANTRLENVKETLQRLSLESARVRLVEVARDDVEKIPAIFEEFAKAIEASGANPYKGF